MSDDGWVCGVEDVTAVIAERDALRYLLGEATAVSLGVELAERFPQLTRFQVRILAALLRVPGTTLTRDQLIAATMVGRPYADWPSRKVVACQIHHMRRHLENSPVHIETVRGFGYRAKWKNAA